MLASATTRERILEAMHNLPADATAEAAIEQIVFIAKVEEGLASLDAGEGISHDVVMRRFRA